MTGTSTPRAGGRQVRMALVGMAMALAACGGGGTSTPTAPAAPPAPSRSVVGQSNWTAEVGTAARIDATIGGAGSMDVTVQWTFSSNDVDIYVTSTGCASHQDLLNNRCTLIAKADGVTAKPERLTLTVQAGTFRIWMANFGPTDESGTVEVGITR